ncbi:MAG: hypothetical protein KJO82_04600 [Gammaproteobacteria bacterium]|nr:hypothetical protein [Gammaproteobacteria bacterium]
MNRTTITTSVAGVLLCLCATATYAQMPVDGLAGFDEWAADAQPAGRVMIKAAPTAAEVGDADSYGNEKTYLGLAQTGAVVIQDDCTGFDPAAGVCIEHAAPPGTTFVDETGLGTIELPEKATDSILCFTFTQFSTWAWANSTGSQQTGSMSLFLTAQIENDALIGLSDPGGNPFNGFLYLDGAGVPTPVGIVVSTSQTTLPDGAFEIQRERMTRSCTGGIVSANSLRAQGLTEAQIKDFFDEPMTVTFGIAGSVSMTDFVSFFGGIRIYGDD